jgi:hypothetical protein
LQNSLAKDENMDEFLWKLWLTTSTKDPIGLHFQSWALCQRHSSLGQSVLYMVCKKLLPIFEFVAKIAAG